MKFFRIMKFADFVCETLFGSQTLSMILLLPNIMPVTAKQERRHSLRIKRFTDIVCGLCSKNLSYQVPFLSHLLPVLLKKEVGFPQYKINKREGTYGNFYFGQEWYKRQFL